MTLMCCLIAGAASDTTEHPLPASVSLEPFFEPRAFGNPEALFWPGYFWLWNAPLDEEAVREQLRDMASHDARSVCMLPMPHAFRPDSTNNLMSPDYLTPEFFAKARMAAEEARRLGMSWWLYDEGGWPSGQALGKVIEGHPEFLEQRLVREPVEAKGPFVVPEDALALIVEKPARKVLTHGATWTPEVGSEAFLYRAVHRGNRANLMNPEAVARFIKLTHEGYKRAIGDTFGGATLFAFTDEPSVPTLDPPKSIPWAPGLDEVYSKRFGGAISDILPSLFVPPSRTMSPADAQARVDFFDLWSGQFRDAYFLQLREWCRRNRLASGGHLNGENETLGAVRHGFGHALRQLRAMDIPGVDVIWRQIFPGKTDNHHFPKYASSAAHQIGARYAFTESFCVYGNGVTPEQMKWIVDYQYVRGINLLVIGCYQLTTQDHHMTGERPHFGRANPLWDHLRGFHAYAARLGYAISVGTPKITTALYYPVRDMWAWGTDATEAVKSHDRLAEELLAHQCDFDLMDDDLLAGPDARVEEGCLVLGAMRYDTVLCGNVCWMHPQSLKTLQRFAESGGRVLCVDHAPGTGGAPGPNEPALFRVGPLTETVAEVEPTVRLSPPSRDLRVCKRTVSEPRKTSGEILMLFNEGCAPYEGAVSFDQTNVFRLDPQTGEITCLAMGVEQLSIRMGAGESMLLWSTHRRPRVAHPCSFTGDTLVLDDTLVGVPRKRFVVANHDFEVITPDAASKPFAQSGVWRTWLGDDFSGEVHYVTDFDLPEAWAGAPLQLETGVIEYGATVLLDGAEIGHMLWPTLAEASPDSTGTPRWRINLPSCKKGHHTLIIRVANTLANELTSERVVKLWSGKSGPGWPSPYHARALEFERDSRGGGLQGPVVLKRMHPAAT